MGELRERRRLALPVVVAMGGMVVPIAIYLAINLGRPSASGWGATMATDTAFALGVLALAGPGVPDRVRTYSGGPSRPGRQVRAPPGRDGHRQWLLS